MISIDFATYIEYAGELEELEGLGIQVPDTFLQVDRFVLIALITRGQSCKGDFLSCSVHSCNALS